MRINAAASFQADACQRFRNFVHIASVVFVSIITKYNVQSLEECMTQPDLNKTNFSGTYFDKDAVIRIARFLKLASWIVAGVYIFQFIVNFGVFILQLIRKLVYIGGPTDLMQQIIWQIQPSLAGLIFFAALQAIALGLLILLDIEDNTRRAARGK